MTEITYQHLVHFDEKAHKVVISRLFESGTTHLYTEIALDQLSAQQKTFEGLATVLGRAILLDTPKLRDEIDKNG